MILNIELSEDMERQLRDRAAEVGKDPTELVRDMIAEELSLHETPSMQRTARQRLAALEALIASARSYPVEVDTSRESLY